MATDEGTAETKLNDRGMVTVPAEIRQRLGLDAGDKLRWTISEAGNLSVEVVRQRDGVFDDFEPVEGPETNAVEIEREFGAE